MSEVAIKGVRNGLLLVLPSNSEWDEVIGQLETKLAAATNLVQGSKAQLDVGDRPLTTQQLEHLVKHLKEKYQLEVNALVGTNKAARSAAQATGFAVTSVPAAQPKADEPKPTATPTQSSGEPAAPPNNALYLRQTLRSGQSIRHDGTIVLCGDVNPGAELIATGDIVVFGTLRGLAHAGASGNDGAQIIAINLRPTQIRIAGYIARSPDAAAPPLSKYPEVAKVQNNEIHILPLKDQ